MNLRWLNCNTSFLFVFSCVRSSGFTSFSTSNDTGFRQQRIRQSGLAMIDMGNHGHVPNVMFSVHDTTDLGYCKVHLETRIIMWNLHALEINFIKVQRIKYWMIRFIYDNILLSICYNKLSICTFTSLCLNLYCAIKIFIKYIHHN